MIPKRRILLLKNGRRNGLLPRGAAFLFVLMICACDNEWQKPPLEAEKFAQVYVGLLQATAGDTLAPACADSVFLARRVAREDFEAAARYYSEHAERWTEVLKLVVALLDTQATRKIKPAPPNPGK